jgi:hypothetical protein
MTYLIPILISAFLAAWATPAIRSKLTSIPYLPTWAQPIPPFALAILAAAAQAYTGGLRGDALLQASVANAGEIGLLAIGIWHTAKRLLPALQKNAGKVSTVLIFGLMSVQCLGGVSKQAAYATGKEALRAFCIYDLSEDPTIRAVAATKGIPIAKYASDYCSVSEVIEPVIQAAGEAIAKAKEKGLLDKK